MRGVVKGAGGGRGVPAAIDRRVEAAPTDGGRADAASASGRSVLPSDAGVPLLPATNTRLSAADPRLRSSDLRPPTSDPAAIELVGVSGGYGGAAVLRDVSLRVPTGRFVGLIGPSGAGKTSLLRAMLGGLPRLRGAVTVCGRAVTPGRPPAGVGYVPQVEAVDWGFPVTVEEVVLMGLIARTGPWPWPSRAERREVAATLERLGLGGLGRRQIRELSGGQQGRTFLARALVGRPDVLLLDEPTASLDVAARDGILRTLFGLNRAGITIVLTTHELNGVAARLPWLVCVDGTTLAEGPPAAVFTGPILSRTFGAPTRVVRDAETGGLRSYQL